MIYQKGDIVWVRFPFSDASSNKIRPALIISNDSINKTGDYLLMQITTRLHNDELSLIISDNDYNGKPLLKRSELRLHKIFILNESLIESKITGVNNNLMVVMREKLLTLLL